MEFEVAFTSHQADALAEVFTAVEIQRAGDMTEIREGLATLTEITLRLAEAQQRTETRVEELAQAQQRSEERLTRVEVAVERLAQAQQRSEERLARTEDRLERVEVAVEQLAQAQARTEESVRALVQAQERTEVALRDLRATVGGLANDFGLTLEEVTAGWLPIYLDHHFGIKYLNLTRISFRADDGELKEVDLAGVGKGVELLPYSRISREPVR